MKKVILLCSFGLLGSFAFAGHEIEEKVEVGESDGVCVPANLSCGVTVQVCGSTTPEIIAATMVAEKKHCPFAPQ